MSKRTSAATKPAEPSLRQRAARLRDAAGRFIRREGEVETSPSRSGPCAHPDGKDVATSLMAPGACHQTAAGAAEAIALVEAIEREWPLMAAAEAAIDDSPSTVAAYEAAQARRRDLMAAAEELPPTSREARHAKALALAWILHADLWRAGRKREDYALDGRLALDIHASMLGHGARATTAAAPSPLAQCCLDRVARLAWLDIPGNTDGMSEKAWDDELDAWNADFRRAIKEPSAGMDDLVAKARLMLDDLNRFQPGERHESDGTGLMRVILREVIAMGGVEAAAAPAGSTDPHPASVPELLRLWSEHKRTEFGWGCPSFSPDDMAAAGAHDDLVEGCMEVLQLPPPRTPSGLAAVALAAAMGFEKTVSPDDGEMEQAFGHLVQAAISATGAAVPSDYTSIFYRHDAGAEA